MFAASWGGTKDALADSDTRAILLGIESRSNWLSWFWTDWPLQNHFYRPVPTLIFAADLALFGRQNAAGFSFTNTLLAAISVTLLYLWSSELFQSRKLGLIAPTAFCAWTLDSSGWLQLFVLVGGIGFLVVKRKEIRAIHLALLFLLYVEVVAISPLFYGTLLWLPGRTATAMTVFCLAACWCQSILFRKESKLATFGLLGSVCLALMSYEQAVMLPLVLTGLAYGFAAKGAKFVWRPTLGSWVILAGYLAARTAIIPVSTSRYQDQQLRFGAGVVISLLDYLSKILKSWTQFLAAFEIGWDSILLPELWITAILWILLGLSLAMLRKAQSRKRLLVIWMASFVAFAPMTFLKPFAHYHFWPMCIRAMLVAVLIGELTNWQKNSCSSPDSMPAETP